MKKVTKPQMIMNVMHGECFLTTEKVVPSKEWLNMQTIKPKKNAVWYRAYPMSGGAVLIDVKNMVHRSRDITEKDIKKAIKISKLDFNPALESIKNLVK